MKLKIIHSSFFIMLVSICLMGFCPIASASDDVEDLKRQVETLKKRIEQLEANQTTLPMPRAPYIRRNRNSDPFEEMRRMQEQMNHLFNESFPSADQTGQSLLNSPMDLDKNVQFNETKEGYEVIVDTSSLDKNKIDIEINEHSITIKGETSQKTQEKNPQGEMHAESFGSFFKTIPLPVDADTTQAKTEKQDNQLVIRMPKKK